MPIRPEMLKRAEVVLARCRGIASCSEDENAIRRTFLSPVMHDCLRKMSDWFVAAGARVSIDAAGNLRAHYSGERPNARRLLLGSHLDSVPNAGAYDGVLGVLIALALLESLQEKPLPFAIEVVGFSEEEGVRFGKPFIGSRALAGTLDDELLDCKDANGVTVRQAIANFGLQPSKLPAAALTDDAMAYLEFHIEQGPVLESLDIPLGIVEAIAGQTRADFIFVGRANHAGTTPMHLRHDAVAGAAEWILGVERIAQDSPGLVATVGDVEATPGASNVIAGETRVTLDLRHACDEVRSASFNKLRNLAQEIAARRGLQTRSSIRLDQAAVPMDAFLAGQIEHAMRNIGCRPHRIVSGAGHDAMIIAQKLSSAMIFLRTPGGISHHPDESVYTEDVALAIECGLQLLNNLAKSTEFQKRMCRV